MLWGVRNTNIVQNSFIIRTVPSVWEFHPIGNAFAFLVDFYHRWGISPRPKEYCKLIIYGVINIVK